MNYLLSKPNFVGFLSAVYDSYYEHKNVDSITSNLSLITLTDSYLPCDEDVDKAKRVKNGILNKGHTFAFDCVHKAYLNGNEKKEQIIFDFLRLLFKHGRAAFDMYDNPAVIAFNDLISKVNREVCRMQGFIRLQEMKNGIYYGFYSSDNDILELIMPHFEKSFNVQKFILHDYKRKKMAYFDGQNTEYFLAPEETEIELSGREMFFQRVFKDYTKTISIKGRENARLQNAFAPKKYRHFMLEF